jgi:hypothetical protein
MAKATVHTGALTADEIAAEAAALVEQVVEPDDKPAEADETPAKRKTRKTGS